ncbi:hypothetical protein B0J17DRAFT_712969 [Rhizoctonia solani]|nr:hypothetical protein B0J17DRAFT_712969 [Rhizoctonia solani]
MSSPSSLGDRVRLRISEIELHPTTSNRFIKGELRISDKVVKELPTVSSGQVLKWSKLIIWRRYASRFEVLPGFGDDGVINKDIPSQQHTAEIKLLDRAQTDALFARGFEKLKNMERRNQSVGRLTAAHRVFISMLEFGRIVADAHPIAKTVFSVCICAWEGLEAQGKCGEELNDLVGRMAGMASLIEDVKPHIQQQRLQQTIEGFLNLIEDVSMFAMQQEAGGLVARRLQSLIDSGARDRVGEYTKRFKAIGEEFRAAIGLQTIAMVAAVREQEILKRLNHVEPSGHDPSLACQEGTRLGVLRDIDDWIHSSEPGAPLMWIFGQAGIGKTTISASVCNRLVEKGIPVVSFFCKRDDPALRDPLRLISSIAYGLACRYPPYGKLIAEEIEKNPELCTSHLGVRYDGLVKKPLSKLQNAAPSSSYIILIDALDECGTTENRRQLLHHLREVSLLVPWLRVIVTSRPDSDIRSFFDKCPVATISHTPLHDYAAASDIRVFIEARLSTIDVEEGWPAGDVGNLCAKAGELFIWAATACRLIVGAFDPHEQLRQLVEGNPSGGGLDNLESLYTTVIRNNIADQGADGASYARRCIGAIVVTSMRQPVPIEVLCELMREHVKPVVVKNVIKRLGAVLYMDNNLDGAVRVYHPSFADFCLDERRSGEFWVDSVQSNIELSIGCLSTMERELKFNICELDTSHLPNREVPDLESKIKSKISRQLAYSCTYWIDHLVDGEDQAVVMDQVGTIINGPRVLYWLEVLSLVKEVGSAVHGLRELSRWLSNADTARNVWDAYRFVLAFFDPISISAPHIYISALALAPKRSKIHRRLSLLFPNTAMITKGEDESWSAWLRSISHPDRVTLRISRDSQMLVTGCNNNWVCIYDLATGRPTRVLYDDYSSTYGVVIVAISPDGTLVAGGTAEQVQIWDTNTGLPVASIPVEEIQQGQVKYWALEFSSDGASLQIISTLSSWSQDEKRIPDEEVPIWAITWDTDSRRVIEQTSLITALDMQNSSFNITAVALAPDRPCLALGYLKGYITLRSKPGESISSTIKVRPVPRSMSFSPDGSMIASSHNSRIAPHATNYSVYFWDTKTGDPVGGVLVGHTDEITSIGFSPDGKRVATSSRDWTVRIWDVKTGSSIGDPLPGHSAEVTSIAFSPDGLCMVSSADDGTVLIWDTSASRSIDVPLLIQANSISDPQSNTIAGDYTQAEGPNDPKDQLGLLRHPSSVMSVRFSPDGTRIISCSFFEAENGTLYIWDAWTGIAIGEPLYHIENYYALDVTYSSNGDYIMGGQYLRAYMWDTLTGRRNHFEIEDSVFAFSLDGSRLVATSTRHEHDTSLVGMTMWDTSTGGVTGQFYGLPWLRINFIALSPDSSRVCSYYYTGSGRGKDHVYIWDTGTYRVVGCWVVDSNSDAKALSPTGNDLVVCSRSNYSINVHNALTGNILIGPLLGHTNIVNSVAFSPDGAQMASSSTDNSIRIWDLKLGCAIAELTGHLQSVNSIAFSPDGSRLVSGSSDGTIRVWDTNNDNASDCWDSNNATSWPSNTFHFPLHPDYWDWLSHDQQSLTLWLPSHYRRPYDTHALYCISADPTASSVHIDFSNFAHGTAWTSVLSQEALYDCHD